MTVRDNKGRIPSNSRTLASRTIGTAVLSTRASICFRKLRAKKKKGKMKVIKEIEQAIKMTKGQMK